MGEYNYASFPLGMTNEDFERFPDAVKAGQKAPEGELIDASDGRKVKLSDYWGKGPVLIEFGSITLPYCGLAARILEPMAEEFAQHGVSFVFDYTREAHPSDSYPCHASIEQKLSHARDIMTWWNIERTVLVDDLEGTVHRAYGTLPNMTYLLSAGGNILYRAS